VDAGRRGRRAVRLAIVCATSMACLRGTLPAVDASQRESEHVITAEQFGRVVTISLRDIFAIRPPVDVEGWQVDFATDILELLNSPETRRSPGPNGWRFRAVGAGETDVALTERPSRDSSAPPAPRKFVVTIRVTR